MSRFWLFALPAVAGAFVTSRSLAAILVSSSLPAGATLDWARGNVDYDELWHGNAPCNASELFTLPRKLPNTSARWQEGYFENNDLLSIDWEADGAPMWSYRHDNGLTIRVAEPSLHPYEIGGATMREVEGKIDLLTKENAALARITNISNTRRLKGAIQHNSARDGYRVDTGRIERQIAIKVWYPVWGQYAKATPDEQDSWDALNCHVLHHELGHLLIALDIYGKDSERYEKVRADTREKLIKDLKVVSQDFFADIRERNKIYHQLNGGYYEPGWAERPYRELPWPWVEEMQADKNSGVQGLRPRKNSAP